MSGVTLELCRQLLQQPSSELSEIVGLHVQLAQEIDSVFSYQISDADGVYRGDYRRFLGENPDYVTDEFSVLEVHGNTYEEIPYHIAYRKEFSNAKQIAEQILERINRIHDIAWDKKRWRAQYQALIDAFTTNAWQDAEKAFLDYDKSNPFLLSIGPIETYHDKVRGTKRFFSCVFMQKETEQLKYEEMWEQLQNIAQSHIPPIPHQASTESANLFVGNVIVASGEVPKLQAEAWSRPESAVTAQRYGSIKMLMLNTFDEKFPRLYKYTTEFLYHCKIESSLKELFLPRVSELLKLNLILHEFGHTYLKPPSSSEHLAEYYSLLEEPRAEINSLYLARLLEVSGALEEETTMLLFLSDLFLFNFKYERFKELGMREEYLFSTSYWYLAAINQNLITIENERIHIDIAMLRECLPQLINQIFIFFNTAVAFGHCRSEQPAVYRRQMEEWTERLYNTLRLNE